MDVALPVKVARPVLATAVVAAVAAFFGAGSRAGRSDRPIAATSGPAARARSRRRGA